MQNSETRIIKHNITPDQLTAFLKASSTLTRSDLEFIPYKRFLLSGYLRDTLGSDAVAAIIRDLYAYERGCVRMDFGSGLSTEECLRLSTAISHLISCPQPSDSSGRYFGIVRVIHDEAPDFRLLDPYNEFSLHTDGVFLDNPVDWLLMMKLNEKNARGGRTRLLHMADFAEYETLYTDPKNEKKYAHGLLERDARFDVFKKLTSTKPAQSRILAKRQGQRTIKFVDQYVLPKTIEEARFISRLQEALEGSSAVAEIELMPGSLILINNNFWMHGRTAFEPHIGLEREILRQYGFFLDHHDHFEALQ